MPATIHSHDKLFGGLVAQKPQEVHCRIDFGTFARHIGNALGEMGKYWTHKYTTVTAVWLIAA